MKYLLGLILLVSVSATAQYSPTATKTRFVNGIGLGTKDTATMNAADTAAMIVGRDSLVYFRYKGYWKPLAYNSSLTGYVPYTGATADVDLDTHILNAQALHAKGTAGNGHVGLKHQSAAVTGTANESNIYANTSGDMSWLNGNKYLSIFATSANTAARTYTFPNTSGTVILSSDTATMLSPYARSYSVVKYTDTATMLSGYKTFYPRTAISAGTGISYNNSTGVVTNSAPDQTVALSSGTGISVSGTYPNFTITNTSPSSGGTVTSVSGTAPISSTGGTTPAISISQSTTSTNGYLSSTDWNTFNGKQPQLNGTGFVKASGTTISYDNNTYLTGNQTITLSGDVSGSGTTAIATSIGALKVTNAMLAGSIDYAKMNSGTVPTWNQNTTGTAANATTWNGLSYYGAGYVGSVLYSMVYDGINNRQGVASVGQMQSWLGLGSNAYTSTAYLPLTGGTLTGALSVTNANINLSNAYSLTARNNANTAYLSLIQRNTSDKVSIDADGYGSVFGGAATFSSSVTAGGIFNTFQYFKVDVNNWVTNGESPTLSSFTSGTELTRIFTTAENVGGYAGWGVKTLRAGADGLATRLYITSQGNVGIGTTSPNSLLEVYGQTRVSASGGSVFLITPDATSTNGITLESSYYASAGYGPMKFNTGGSERMRITSGGNVLVGTTTNAGYKLDVNGTVRFSGILTGQDAIFNLPATTAFELNSTTGYNSSINYGVNGTYYWTAQILGDAGNLGRYRLYSYSAGEVFSLNYSTGAATFSSSVTASALGLGVTPVTKLDVRGTSASADATLQIVGNSVSALLLGQNSRGGVIRGQGGNNELSFWTGGSIDVAASGSGTERMRLTLGGNLLIGSTNDNGSGAKLQVTSDVTISSNLTAGGNLLLGASASTIGALNFVQTGSSPIASRITFGTDGTGYNFAISKNQSGTITDLLSIADSGAATFSSSIKTAIPTSWSAAGAWKLGTYFATTVALNTTGYITVDIGGTLYYLALASPL